MSDITVSPLVDTLLRSTTTVDIKNTIDLGNTSSPVFQSIDVSQLTFPDLTTAELDGVLDANVGDVYFDTDRGQFVRFTSNSSYDTVGSVGAEVTVDNSSGASSITLANSGFNPNLIDTETNPSAPTKTLNIIPSNPNIDAGGGTTYFYWGGGSGMSAGWYATGSFAASNSVVISPDSTLKFNNGADKATTTIKYGLASTTTKQNLFTKTLKQGVKTEITLDFDCIDALGSNLELSVDFTSTYTSSFAELEVKDVTSKEVITNPRGSISQAQLITLNGNTFASSPNIGRYKLTLLIEPAGNGVLTVSAGQLLSSVSPVFISGSRSKTSNVD